MHQRFVDVEDQSLATFERSTLRLQQIEATQKLLVSEHTNEERNTY